jgi:hypothetical protein
LKVLRLKHFALEMPGLEAGFRPPPDKFEPEQTGLYAGFVPFPERMCFELKSEMKPAIGKGHGIFRVADSRRPTAGKGNGLNFLPRRKSLWLVNFTSNTSSVKF